MDKADNQKSPEYLAEPVQEVHVQHKLIHNYDDIMGRAWALRVTDNNEEADELLRNAGIIIRDYTDGK